MEKTNLSIYLIPLAVIIAIGLIGLALWSQNGSVVEPDPNGISEVGLGNLPPLGDKDAPITLVQFSDYQCSFCANFLFDTENRLREELVAKGEMRIYWRDFAAQGQGSVDAAVAARCANEQGKFWQYHDLLFAKKQEGSIASFNKENLESLAVSLELDSNQFSACLSSDKYLDDVQADFEDGRELGIQGTPTVFINGEKIVGAQPYEVFMSVINKYLK